MKNTRCDWAMKNSLEMRYHDDEWGIEIHDDIELFERLTLESMQAGLSWLTILKKRDSIRQAFDAFDYSKIALYKQQKIDQLLANPKIIRHELKIKATITNAQAYLRIQEEYGSFNQFIWSFTQFKPIKNHWITIEEVPSFTELSIRISQELKKKGFKFLGKTTVYAFMQAIGMVDDHLITCCKKIDGRIII